MWTVMNPVRLAVVHIPCWSGDRLTHWELQGCSAKTYPHVVETTFKHEIPPEKRFFSTHEEAQQYVLNRVAHFDGSRSEVGVKTSIWELAYDVKPVRVKRPDLMLR
jgi:hypothetical protein